MIKIYSPKNFISRFIGILLAAFLFYGCERDDDGSFVHVVYPDLSTQVKSTVSGFVTDENDQPVNLANVQVGQATVSTDKYGYFEVKNADVIQNAAVVTVTKSGYFKGIKTYIAEEGKPAFFRIKLLPKNNAGTINAGTGGSVTLANGLSIVLPANAVVNAASGAPYSGTVKVAAQWLNPTANDLPNTMPGDLRGLNSSGKLQLLTTYGMAAVELTGSSGELLQIAPGKKATVSVPIPASLIASAPASIPIWYFDETKGLWKEEGEGVKNGNNYTAEVSHFSFWNWDLPGYFVQFNCTIVDQNNNPVSNAAVKVSLVSDPNKFFRGYTNTNGYISGPIPVNAQLKLEVFPDFSCSGTVLAAQTFTSTTVNISLGNIVVNNAPYIIRVNGTATNCSNAALSQGIATIRCGFNYYNFPVTNGNYNFALSVCNTPATASISVLDLSTQQVSLPQSFTVNAGSNTIPNIQACGTVPAEYTYYTVDGTPYFQSSGTFYFRHSGSGAPNNIDVFSTSLDPAMTIPHSGFTVVRPAIIPPASALLNSFSIYNLASGNPFPNPITVNYTEYGSIGQYIAGNFAGTIKNTSTNVIYNITGSFRMKRNF